jgi:hypothetical protein
MKPNGRRRRGFGFLVRLAVFIGVVWWMLRAVMGEKAAEATLATLVRAPIDLRNEIVAVGAKSSRAVPIEVPYSGTVELNVQVIKGKHVNVYVITPSAWQEFVAAKSALFGGQYHHFPEFQAEEASKVRLSGRLAEGHYYVVIENPTFGILVPSSFDVEIKATLHP